jgi:hypothetical protein
MAIQGYTRSNANPATIYCSGEIEHEQVDYATGRRSLIISLAESDFCNRVAIMVLTRHTDQIQVVDSNIQQIVVQLVYRSGKGFASVPEKTSFFGILRTFQHTHTLHVKDWRSCLTA